LQLGWQNTPKKRITESADKGPQAPKKEKEKFGVNNTRRIFAVRSKIFNQFFKILHTVFTSSVNN